MGLEGRKSRKVGPRLKIVLKGEVEMMFWDAKRGSWGSNISPLDDG